MRRLVTVLVLTVGAAATADARWPSEAPPLPPPDPGVFTIINVDTAQELADACWNLTSNQAIVIAPGTYELADVVFPNGVDGRLTVGRYGAPPIANLQIRGATGDPGDVVIRGAGMAGPIRALRLPDLHRHRCADRRPVDRLRLLPRGGDSE